MMLTSVCGRPTKEEDSDGNLTLGFKDEDSMCFLARKVGDEMAYRESNADRGAEFRA